MTTVSNRASAFYSKGLYDPSIPHLDYLTAGSQPLRKGFNLDQATQPEFNGKRLVVTEQKDPAVCSYTSVEQRAYKDMRMRELRWFSPALLGSSCTCRPHKHDLNWL